MPLEAAPKRILTIPAWVEEVTRKESNTNMETVKFTTYLDPNEDEDSPDNNDRIGERGYGKYVATEFEVEIMDPKYMGKFKFGRKYALTITEIKDKS